MTLRVVPGGRERPAREDDDALRASYAALMREAAAAPDGHPDEDTWLRLSCDELDEDARQKVAEHVVRCADCARIYRGVVELQRGAREIEADARFGREPDAVPAPRSRLPLVQMGFAAAAILAVLVGGALMVRRSRPSGPQVSAVASTAQPRPAPHPAPRAWALAIHPPEVTLPAEFAITMRSPDAERRGFLDAFGAAITPYRAGQYRAAATALSDLAGRYPDVKEVRFFLGAALLLDGQAREALEPLAAAGGSPALRDDARWLRAVALERAGEPAAAEGLLEELCGDHGGHQADACRALGTTVPAKP